MENQHPGPVPPEDKVPLKEKLAYGVGGFSGGLSVHMDNALVKPIFNVALGISPAIISIFEGLYRVWDAITDSLMGGLSDNTRTRWGRRRPYLVIGGVLVSLWMPMLWAFNSEWDIFNIVLWMVGANLILLTFGTIWNVPYSSMLFEISPNSTERTNVAAVRAYFGKICWTAMGWIWWIAQRPIFNDADGNADPLNGARWVTAMGAVLVLVCCLMPAFFCKERFYASAKKQKRIRLLVSIKSTFKDKPFLRLILLAFLLVLAQSAAMAMGFFVELDYVCKGDTEFASWLLGLRSTLTMFSGFAAIPLIQWIANRYGKRFGTMFVLSVFFLWGIASWYTFNPNYPYLLMLNGVLFSIANTGIWVLIPSMTGDVVDHDELQTGERREGMFSAVFAWMFKLSSTLGGTLSGLFVVSVGYRAELAREGILQSHDVLFSMRVAMVVMPLVFMGIALWVMARYPLTTRRMKEIRNDLEKRRGTLGN